MTDTVLVAGASGRTGRQLLAVLRDADYQVRAHTTSPGRATDLERQGADEVAVGDLRSRGDAEAAVDGADAVVSAVGSSPAAVLRGGELVDGRGNVNLVESAAAAGADRFVMLSSLGVDGDRGSLMARAFRLAVRPVIEAKTTAERAVRSAGVTYTIFRPGVLTRQPARGDVLVADAGAGLWGTVSRAEVAQLMVAALATPECENRTLEVVRNPLLGDRGLHIDWQFPEA